MNSDGMLNGRSILTGLKDAGVSHVVSVPDLTTSEGVLRPLATDPDLRLIRICREEEGVGICAGLVVTGQRPVMLIQYTGFMASINAIRAMALEYRQPICMLVGLLFADSPDDPTQSRNLGISRLVPLIEALGLRYFVVSDDRSASTISPGLNAAFEASEPVVFLLSRYPQP